MGRIVTQACRLLRALHALFSGGPNSEEVLLSMWRLLALLVLAACATTPDRPATVLAIGDSVLAFHSLTGGSVPEVAGRLAGVAVENRAVSGARFSATSPRVADKGGDIRRQYEGGPWETLLVNGGANDLMSECGCRACAATLDELVTADGRKGQMPEFLRPIAQGGTHVVILGYYDGNSRPNVFSGCSDEIDVLNARLARFASSTAGVDFISAAPAMDPDDQSLWYVDRVHPSRKGSARIGELLAPTLVSGSS